MSQQLAVIVLVDVASALKAKALKGHTYLFDNMKLMGSENQGTSDLVTAINGSYWSDGSQAAEQVLNWLPYSLDAIPPTVPKSFHADRSRAADQATLEALAQLVRDAGKPDTNLVAELNRIHRNLGTKTKVKSTYRSGELRSGHKVLDITGEIVSLDAEGNVPALSQHAPLITDITGEAVDKQIIFPAQYGSPDLVTDGWYWSASVDTSRPGTYSYTMEIHLRELTWGDGEWIWKSVRMTHDSQIKIITEPKRNGFTQAGLGTLPIR